MTLSRKKTNTIVKVKATPMSSTSKERQTKENVPVKSRSRSQTPKGEDGCLHNGPKAQPSKALPEHKSPEVKAKANRDPSNKEKVIR